MSPRWLFFPTPASDYLQEITWNMTGYNTASVVSTGLEIIWLNGISLRVSAGVPRLINGSEALNYGATASSGTPTEYHFSSGSACRTWWNNYAIEMEKNGGGFQSIGDPVGGSCQPQYLNVTSNLPPGSGTEWVSGDIIKFRISTAS